VCEVLGRKEELVVGNKQRPLGGGGYIGEGGEKVMGVEQDKDGAGYLIWIADWVQLTVSVCGGAQ
jgi:hypothetical protein